MFWTPGSLIQAEDRAHRIGQRKRVTVKYFLADGTVDDVLWPLVKKKVRTLGEVVEGEAGSVFASTESGFGVTSKSTPKNSTKATGQAQAPANLGNQNQEISTDLIDLTKEIAVSEMSKSVSTNSEKDKDKDKTDKDADDEDDGDALDTPYNDDDLGVSSVQSPVLRVADSVSTLFMKNMNQSVLFGVGSESNNSDQMQMGTETDEGDGDTEQGKGQAKAKRGRRGSKDDETSEDKVSASKSASGAGNGKGVVDLTAGEDLVEGGFVTRVWDADAELEKLVSRGVIS